MRKNKGYRYQGNGNGNRRSLKIVTGDIYEHWY